MSSPDVPRDPQLPFASRGTVRSSGSDGVGESRHGVAIWVQGKYDGAPIRDAVAAANARPMVLAAPFPSHDDAEQARAAVVVIDASDPCEGMEVVRWFASRGTSVVACGALSGEWPLALQCQLLLAGAAALLDLSAPAFRERLTRDLAALLHADACRGKERDHLVRTMLAHGLVARSNAMLETFRRALKIAPLTDLPVLICGESGTGKELFARAIHALDPVRTEQPFVAVNCAAIPPNTAESELFGHRKGAFTGADRDRAGLIRSAQGGVLFLDEIGELSLELQAKLLRVLQDKRVLGVGADRDQPVDVRVIAATHRDLSRMVADRQFRLDLYHRLNVVSLRIAPLRERPEDIRPLVAHLLARQCGGAATACTASEAFLSAVSRLALPGNVRELENLITQALLSRAGEDPLSLGDLPRDALVELAASAPALASNAAQAPDLERNVREVVQATGWHLSKALRVYERMVVQAALRKTARNQSEAAKLLGVTPRTIYNLVRRHDLNN